MSYCTCWGSTWQYQWPAEEIAVKASWTYRNDRFNQITWHLFLCRQGRSRCRLHAQTAGTTPARTWEWPCDRWSGRLQISAGAVEPVSNHMQKPVCEAERLGREAARPVCDMLGWQTHVIHGTALEGEPLYPIMKTEVVRGKAGRQFGRGLSYPAADDIEL